MLDDVHDDDVALASWMAPFTLGVSKNFTYGPLSEVPLARTYMFIRTRFDMARELLSSTGHCFHGGVGNNENGMHGYLSASSPAFGAVRSFGRSVGFGLPASNGDSKFPREIVWWASPI